MKTKVKHGHGGSEAKSGVPAASRPPHDADIRRALVPRRTTPRPAQEALAISKALRKRFISPEAAATAKRLLAEKMAAPAAPAEEPFTASERERAAEILAHIRKKYPRQH